MLNLTTLKRLRRKKLAFDGKDAEMSGMWAINYNEFMSIQVEAKEP